MVVFSELIQVTDLLVLIAGWTSTSPLADRTSVFVTPSGLDLGVKFQGQYLPASESLQMEMRLNEYQ